MKVEIEFDILEYFIRQSERVAVIEDVATNYPYASMDLIKVICGRQLDDSSEDKTTEQVVIEADGLAIKNAVDKLREDFLEENYELREETSSESTPPRRTFRPVCG